MVNAGCCGGSGGSGGSGGGGGASALGFVNGAGGVTVGVLRVACVLRNDCLTSDDVRVLRHYGGQVALGVLALARGEEEKRWSRGEGRRKHKEDKKRARGWKRWGEGMREAGEGVGRMGEEFVRVVGGGGVIITEAARTGTGTRTRTGMRSRIVIIMIIITVTIIILTTIIRSRWAEEASAEPVCPLRQLSSS